MRLNSELYNAKDKVATNIPWNFAKFLVDGEGKVVSYYGSKVAPNDILKDIKKLLII